MLNVNTDSKEVLARLLAEEELSVVFRNVRTASFSLKSRVLTLPVMQTSNLIINWHVSHEVGHALFTPIDEYSKLAMKVGDLANIIEDIRINKKIVDRYPGLGWVRDRGYIEMFDLGFFGDHDLNTLSFPDRINIHFKVGLHASVKFSDKEFEIVETIKAVQSFADVVSSCEMLNRYLQENKSDQDESEDKFEPTFDGGDDSDATETDSETDGGDDSDDVAGTAESDAEAGNDSDKTHINPDRTKGAVDDNPPEPFKSVTVENEANSIEDTTNTDDLGYYRTVPHIPHWKSWILDYKEFNDYVSYYNSDDQELLSFRKTNQKIIEDAAQTFLVNRKVDYSSPELTYHSGVIDFNRLHSYQYDDNVFLREITIKDNSTKHGLCMFVDFSYSMKENLFATIQQLLNLVFFAQEAQIPFKVYGFTYLIDTVAGQYDYTDCENIMMLGKAKNNMKSLFEMFTSNMSMKEINDMANKMLVVAKKIKRGDRYNILGSTPLQFALHVAKYIGEEFKTEYGIEKLEMIFLTDGASDTVDNMLPSRSRTCHITDQVLKKTSDIHGSYDITKFLSDNLGEYLDANVTNFFVGAHDKYKYLMPCGGDFPEIVKNAVYAVNDRLGFENNFILNENNFNVENVNIEFGSKRSATASFARRGKLSKTTRTLMNLFAEQIA